MLQHRISRKLNQRQQQFLTRKRLTVELLENNQCIVNGKQCIQFCNNDYLSLSKHPLIQKAVIKALEQFGVGATASPLVVGFSKQHQQLEQEIAEFVGQERALIFSSGYVANLALMSSLTNKDDIILADKLNHASLVDACRSSQANFVRYQHLDIEQLKNKLTHQNKKHAFIVSDSIFSMSGDVAPIKTLLDITQQFNATLVLDDSHGIGVVGKHGNGTAQTSDFFAKKPIYTAGFGKAFACSGGFIAGSADEIEYVMQLGRHYIYSTAISPMLVAAIRASLTIVQQETWRRDWLQVLIDFFKLQAETLMLPVTSSVTPIQSIVIGDAQKALELEQFLLDKGMLVRAIRPPSVPTNQSLLRIVLTAMHTELQIEQLLLAIKQWFQRYE